MINQLDQLYREVILDHYRNSSHRGKLEDTQITHKGDNPLCGDELIFYIKMNGSKVSGVRFDGKGCAISMAAASMISDQLEGKEISEIAVVINTMKSMMRGGGVDSSVDIGDLESLAGVRKFPVRVKCAALSWNVVEEALEEYSKKQKRAESKCQ